MEKLFLNIANAILKIPIIHGLFLLISTYTKKIVTRLLKRREKYLLNPRIWSNKELEKFAALFHGDVINVSGWKDADKTGRKYKDYFAHCTTYTISNYYGEKGLQHADNEIFVDLEKDIPEEYINRFDVVFNHTTLEHVFDIKKAIENLCLLSKDTIILITPFLQQVHDEGDSFGDFWRPTPKCIERMLRENGFTIIYQSGNDNEWSHVYIFTIATKNPEKYRGKIPFKKIDYNLGERLFGLK